MKPQRMLEQFEVEEVLLACKEETVSCKEHPMAGSRKLLLEAEKKPGWQVKKTEALVP